MKFLESRKLFSLYRDEAGELRAFYHNTGWGTTGLNTLDEDDVLALANEFGLNSEQVDILAGYPLAAEWCEKCDSWCDETREVDGYSQWCDSCRDGVAWECDDCTDLVTETSEVDGGRYVCGGCRDNNYSWCAECDTYYPDGDYHSHSCDCEPLPLGFDIRGAGYEIRNDTRIDVTLPDGEVDEAGETAIREVLRRWMLENQTEDVWGKAQRLVEMVGTTYKTGDGTYAKRMRRIAYKQGIVMPDDLVEQVGNLARMHSKGATLAVEITRNLNMGREAYANEDSCWWSDYAYSRCTLKANGGFALRSFNGYGYVEGRAWVLPLVIAGDTLMPTHGDADAYVVFNGYGELSEQVGPRTMATMTGMMMRKRGFDTDGWEMYFNGGSGYIVAPSEIHDDLDEGRLSLVSRLNQHELAS